MMAYQRQLPSRWLAVPYSSSYREPLLRTFKVRAVPTLLVFAPDGQLVDANGARANMSLHNVEYWERTARQPQLGAAAAC